MGSRAGDGSSIARDGRRLSAEQKVELLLEVSRRSRGTLDLVETLDLLLDAVATVIDYDAAGIFALNEDLYPVRDRPAGLIAGVARRGFLERPVEEDAMLSAGRGIVGHAIRSGRSVLVPDVRLDPRYVVGRAEALSEIAVPISVDGRTIAALDVESDRVGAFDEGDVETLEFFAQAAALAIEKALLHRHLIDREQIQAQLRIAREVQRSLLPREAPAIPGYDLAGLCLPSLELSGDDFDYLRFAGGGLGLVIADVAGKGVPAALIMATFRALLRAKSGSGAELAETVSAVNRLLRDASAPRAFVTCFYGVLEPASGRLEYASCGHPPALVQRAAGGIEELDNCGPALGVFPEAGFEQRTTSVGPGDRLVLFTDGLLESRNAVGEQFGVGRLRAALAETPELDAAALAAELVARARAFSASSHLADDLTLVVLRRNARA